MNKIGHLANEKNLVYEALAEHLNRLPQSAPINETLMEVLHRLYTETEAQVASRFPLVPMTLDKIAGVMGMPENEMATILEEMSAKGLVTAIPRKEAVYYSLAPVLVGFFETTFMRTGDQASIRELAELFEQYFQDAEVKEAVLGSDTKTMRTMVYESIVPLAVETEVLSYERVSEIIKQSGGGAISMCPCRHKASHLGKACDAPLEVCTSLGTMAKWLVSKGLAKPASVEELLHILDQTQKLGLVHLCDNVMNKPAGICHCCGCCCTLIGNKDSKGAPYVHPSNFIPVVDVKNCLNCSICADRCQVKAIKIRDIGGGFAAAVVDENICIGCGVCVEFCPVEAIHMERRATRIVPPENHRDFLKRFADQKNRM